MTFGHFNSRGSGNVPAAGRKTLPAIPSKTEPLKAYLDFNIIVAIDKGDIHVTDLNKLDPGILEFPFSASHIQEIDNISHPDRATRESYLKSHLDTISNISQDLYLYQNMDNEVFFLNKSPFEVLMTITEVPFAKTSITVFTEILSPKMKQETRNALGISTKELNNSKAEDVIPQLNSVLPRAGFQGTFLDLIEKSIESHPQGKSFGLSHRIAACYELLDLFGYWKDKQTRTSNIARLWDSNHAFFAAHCNYFVSDDLRNRNKAKVTYDLFKIGTKTVSSKGLN